MYKLSEKQLAVCQQAVEQNGFTYQMRKVIQELRELADELEAVASGHVNNRARLVDEIVDVVVSLNSLLRILFPHIAQQVKKHIATKIEKLKRLLDAERHMKKPCDLFGRSLPCVKADSCVGHVAFAGRTGSVQERESIQDCPHLEKVQAWCREHNYPHS